MHHQHIHTNKQTTMQEDYDHCTTSFLCFCKYGYLEYIKEMNEKNEIMNDENKSALAFLAACENGHLETAKWLLEQQPNINISAHGEFIFRNTCCKGHLKIAQWLLEKKPDIDISSTNNNAFHLAWNNNKLKVVKWLQSLYPWLYVIYKDEQNNICYHINTEEEQKAYFKEVRFQRRKYIVWLYSSAPLHKKSTLHLLPRELLREISMIA